MICPSSWGSVESYPPEHADVVILAAKDEKTLHASGLHMLKCELESDVCLVVNKKNSMKKKNIPEILKFFANMEIKQ